MNGVSERLPESAVYMGDRPGRQGLTVLAAVLGQVTVELGEHGRTQGLQPHMSDARHGVVIDVVPVSGERFGLNG